MASLVPLLLLLLLAIHGTSGARTLEDRKAGVTQYCSGWIANTDNNNIVGWKVTPPVCQGYIKRYIQGGQYMVDFGLGAEAAGSFLQTLEPTDGRDAMVFDIDETLLSNLPYYGNHSYGGEAFNATSFNEWVYEGSAPPLKPTLELYNKLRAQNWVLILLTGRDEIQRNVTVENLIGAGITGWNELVLRQPAEAGVPASIFKSTQRVALQQSKGYTIRSCIGDQWSDCAGPAAGNRTFKLANPMYFIA